jgi:hypothetical protein
VKSRTFLVGMGDKFDVKQTKTMKKGDSGTMAAQQHHFAMAKGKTIVDVKSTGPFAITYVNPADDPRQHHGKRRGCLVTPGAAAVT